MRTNRPKAASAPRQKSAQFVYTNPKARSVFVAGSFNNWSPSAMVFKGQGIWTREVPLSPGEYEYCFVVDGKWIDDPKASDWVPSSFGGKSSVLSFMQERQQHPEAALAF